MDRIIKTLSKRYDEGLDSMLVVLTNDSENAPRGIGACMVVGKTGLVGGTIGGGMLEYKAIQMAQKQLAKKESLFYHFGLKADSASELGMVCGGEVDALFTYIAPTEENGHVLAVMMDALTHHQSGWMLLTFDACHMVFMSGGVMTGMDMPAERAEIAAVTNAAVLETAQGPYYVQMLRVNSRAFIFGGGHLAQELVPVLDHLGFRCIVTDDRPDFSTAELFPAAEAVFTRNFTELAGHYDVQPDDYIICVTRGHKGDFDVESFALTTPAYYIGCVGSRPKIAYVNSKLREAGFTDEDIARVTSPIGLDIGSETPAEIAISIAGQLIARRAALTKQRRQAGNHHD